jgi:hypothetical protein
VEVLSTADNQNRVAASRDLAQFGLRGSQRRHTVGRCSMEKVLSPVGPNVGVHCQVERNCCCTSALTIRRRGVPCIHPETLPRIFFLLQNRRMSSSSADSTVADRGTALPGLDPGAAPMHTLPLDEGKTASVDALTFAADPSNEQPLDQPVVESLRGCIVVLGCVLVAFPCMG